MSSYEGSKQFLQMESSDGVSLYDHLARVLLKVRLHVSAVVVWCLEKASIHLPLQQCSTSAGITTSISGAFAGLLQEVPALYRSMILQPSAHMRQVLYGDCSSCRHRCHVYFGRLDFDATAQNIHRKALCGRASQDHRFACVETATVKS